METIRIKPLSLNEAYRGRRFKTKELETYHTLLAYMLPPITLPKGRLSVKYEFGVSSQGADGDNLIKCFQDSIARKYGFNDNQIYHWDVTKKIVKKGEEYAAFEIRRYHAANAL